MSLSERAVCGCGQLVAGMGLAWQPAFLVVILLYFYSHYLFASGAAHIGAMYTVRYITTILLMCFNYRTHF
jgi:di/tricarboxylate transporter